MVFLELILIRIHELFYIVVGILPILSTIVFIYYAAIYVVKRSKRNKLLFLSILAVCLIKYTDHWISFRPGVPEKAIELKILTWNVQRLGAFSENQNSANNLKQLSRVLNSSKTDIAVIQEISKRQTDQLSSYLNLHTENLQWTSYFYGSKGGLAILLLNNNDWSMSTKVATDLPPSWKCVYSEIKHRTGQKINVLGVHIAPPKVTDNQVIQAIQKGFSGIKTILKRYVRQAEVQTQQIDRLNNLVSKFNDPTIIAGAFNSTCQLPIHRELRGNLNDTWLERGIGIGATRYWAGILPFRIDYIYASDNFEIITTNIGKARFSDHNPVISNLFIKK